MIATRRSMLLLLLASSIPTLTAIQPDAAPAQPNPLRDLEFGDINFLHTTDTHGWHAGHLLEPSYSADWGDYISFTQHLRSKLEAEGKDLIVIDTGDRIEGNGLYDSSIPRGQFTFPIFDRQHIDLLCVGNHELYKNTSAVDDFTKLVPAYADNYLASNLQIYHPETGELVDFARRYKTFTTKHGVRIAAFGFIFDFTRNDKITVVNAVESVVLQPWFKDVVRSVEVDLFLVIGHVALRQTEMEAIYESIRSVRPNIPIHFFGGHFHIRDYRVFDDQARALASGRFMETIGFASISNLSSSNPIFTRRYIDNNLYSLHHHSNTTAEDFDTPTGLDTSAAITEARSVLQLDQTFGCAPQTYWMSRVPYPHPSSIFSLLVDQMFPAIINPSRHNKSRMLLTNTGAIRFDLFAGPFTRDSTFIVSPFTSNLSFIPDVPYSLARKLLPILNSGGPQTLTRFYTETRQIFSPTDLPPMEQQAKTYPSVKVERDAIVGQLDLDRFWRRLQIVNSASDLNPRLVMSEQERGTFYYDDQRRLLTAMDDTVENLRKTPGYTTADDLGSDGDDTIHSPIAFYDVPNVVQAIFPANESKIDPNATMEYRQNKCGSEAESQHAGDDEAVDLVFNQFLTPYIIHILNILPYDQCLQDEYGLEVYDLLTSQERFFKVKRECEDAGLVGCPGTEWSTEKIQTLIDVQAVRRDVLDAVEKREFSERDVSNYVPDETFTTLLAKWVSMNWKDNCAVSGRDADAHYEL